MRMECPYCRDLFEPGAAAGAGRVFCPSCGRGIDLPGSALGVPPAALGGEPARTSRMAILACVCGVLALAWPVCGCLPFLMAVGLWAAPSRTVTVAPPPTRVLASPVPVPAPVEAPEVPPEPPEDPFAEEPAPEPPPGGGR